MDSQILQPYMLLEQTTLPPVLNSPDCLDHIEALVLLSISLQHFSNKRVYDLFAKAVHIPWCHHSPVKRKRIFDPDKISLLSRTCSKSVSESHFQPYDDEKAAPLKSCHAEFARFFLIPVLLESTHGLDKFCISDYLCDSPHDSLHRGVILVGYCTFEFENIPFADVILQQISFLLVNRDQLAFH